MTEAEKKAIAYHQRLHDLLREAYNIATDMQVEDTLRKQGVKWIDIPLMNYPWVDMRGVPDLTDECPLCGNAETCKECAPPLKYAELKPIKAEVPEEDTGFEWYRVNVRRVVREETYVRVRATSKRGAVDLAVDEAMTVQPQEWECYDCEYISDEDDVIKGE